MTVTEKRQTVSESKSTPKIEQLEREIEEQKAEIARLKDQAEKFEQASQAGAAALVVPEYEDGTIGAPKGTLFDVSVRAKAGKIADLPPCKVRAIDSSEACHLFFRRNQVFTKTHLYNLRCEEAKETKRK